MIINSRYPVILSAFGSLLLLCGITLWVLDLPVDQRVLDALRLMPGSTFASIAAAISSSTGVSVLGPLALLMIAWLIWRRHYRRALWLFLVIATGRLAVETMKLVFQEPRPPLSGQLATVTSFSFPSSHSAGSMLTFLAFALLSGWRRDMMIALAIAAAMLVGWSRMALGVHWPSDVLAGLGFAMLWVGAGSWLLKARLSRG